MRVARPKMLAAFTGVLVLAGVGAAAQGRREADQAMAREQLALADRALEGLHRLAQNSRVELSDPAFSVWGRRKLETLRRTGAPKAEVVGAIEKYIEQLKEEEALANARHKAARGTLIDVFDVQYRRLEAEGWLAEEKGR